MSRQGKFELGDYNDVASRIAEFREKHPDGRLRPVNPEQPYRIETIGTETFIVYVAAAYRSADDVLPGIGVAQEVCPGKTNYTRGSELQNAETSAWGRAIVAALAADTKRGIASAEEVRNRQAERDAEWEQAEKPPTDEQVAVYEGLAAELAAVTQREDIGLIGGRVKHAQAEGLLTAAQYRALGVQANKRKAELQVAA